MNRDKRPESWVLMNFNLITGLVVQQHVFPVWPAGKGKKAWCGARPALRLYHAL
jgi:hypothetical protein